MNLTLSIIGRYDVKQTNHYITSKNKNVSVEGLNILQYHWWSHRTRYDIDDDIYLDSHNCQLFIFVIICIIENYIQSGDEFYRSRQCYH
jgi:hypothetical protein